MHPRVYLTRHCRGIKTVDEGVQKYTDRSVAFGLVVGRSPEHLLIASNRFWPTLWETAGHPV